MKIYDYDRRYSPYMRYDIHSVNIEDRMLYEIRLLPDKDFYYIILKQNILYNRPFKMISYSICSSDMMTNSIRQEIITNIKYRPKAKEDIYLSIKYFIYDINSKNMNYSRLDIHILYRVMNHFLHKNKINSI